MNRLKAVKVGQAEMVYNRSGGDSDALGRPRFHPIENCEFEFKCPYVSEELDTDLIACGEALCSRCEKTVYKVSDQQELEDHVSVGHCVAFVRHRKVVMKGIVSRR